MTSIDGAIWMKIDMNHPQTTDVNISKDQPPKASGLGGVQLQRSKSPDIFYKGPSRHDVIQALLNKPDPPLPPITLRNLLADPSSPPPNHLMQSVR